MDVRIDPAAPYGDHVLVHCPRCDQKASIDARSSRIRLTCSSCALVQQHTGRGNPASLFETYNDGDSLFGERLWLETTSCGEHRLWALNLPHLDYIERFVLSTNRDAEFPSLSGNRQLSDKFPAWLSSNKHRSEIARALRRLRATL